MRNKFYLEESRRLKEKNYIFYFIIGSIWVLYFVAMCSSQYNGCRPLEQFYGYLYLQFFGTFSLMSSVSENLYFVKELGKRTPRLKKYECVPLMKKQCILAYEAIMAKYLLILIAGFLILYFSVSFFTRTRLLLYETITGILWFILASTPGYLWFTVLNIAKTRK